MSKYVLGLCLKKCFPVVFPFENLPGDSSSHVHLLLDQLQRGRRHVEGGVDVWKCGCDDWHHL